MDDVTLPIFPRQKPRLPAEEVEQRRESLRQADANSRLEGQYRDPAHDDIFEASVRGDIEVTDVVPLLKARLGLR